MTDDISVFSDWNTWFNFAKQDWDYAVTSIKSELESCKTQHNADSAKINQGESRLVFALRRAKTYDPEWAYYLCRSLLPKNQLNSELISFFIETLCKTNHINDAIKYSEIYKQHLSKKTLVELYAKTGNIQKTIDIIYNSLSDKIQERERERERERD